MREFHAREHLAPMILLGLTGGLGMGKSTAASLLSAWGVSTIDTDVIARQVVESGQPTLQEIQKRFGSEFIDHAGGLRRAELARLVFADPEARQALEAILHPRIREIWLAETETWRRQGLTRGVVVIPLLFETKAASHFDATVCLACSKATQWERLGARGWTQLQITQRLHAQWPASRKMDAADFVIWNEGSVDLLGQQLRKVLEVSGG
jgi:dephospho-CoA kinase